LCKAALCQGFTRQLPLVARQLIAKLFAAQKLAKDCAMTGRPTTCALAFFWLALSLAAVCHGQLKEQLPNSPPALEQTPVTAPTASQPESQPKEKLARVWANEPPLVRLARDRFGAELTETDARFFAAVAANDWADLRASSDVTFNVEKPSSWTASPCSSRSASWLCTDATATKLVPSHGIWLRE